MIAVTIQRHLVISRLPRRISSGISHFSTNRQSLGIGRAPIRVVKRKSDVAKPLRSPPQENPQENPRFPTTLSLPKSLLVEAEIAGKLSVSWHEAESILNEFDETELKSGSPKNLCSKYNIGPRVFTQLAQILLSTGVQAYFTTVQGLLLVATELEDPGAVLLLVQEDLKRKGVREEKIGQVMKRAYEVLGKLVRTENPAALFLTGRKYERQGKTKLALEMYLKSTEITAGVYTGADSVNISHGDAWTAIGKLRMQGNDKIGAKQAIRKAALEYDDSAAYLYLATKLTDPSSDKYVRYLLKAAISEETQAAGELGAFYFKKLQKSGSFIRKSSHPTDMDSNKPVTLRVGRGQFKDQDEWELWTQAFEWLSLASERKIASSQVYYAIMCRALSKPNVGLQWLEEASQSPKLATTIIRLKEMWFSEDLDLSDFNLEKVLQNKDN